MDSVDLKLMESQCLHVSEMKHTLEQLNMMQDSANLFSCSEKSYNTMKNALLYIK